MDGKAADAPVSLDRLRFLAEALASANRYADACEYANRALALAQCGDRVGEAMSCRALARVAAAGGAIGLLPPERYIEMAHESARVRESAREDAVTWLAHAELIAPAGRRTEAAELLERAGQAFDSMAMTWFAARAQQLACKL